MWCGTVWVGMVGWDKCGKTNCCDVGCRSTPQMGVVGVVVESSTVLTTGFKKDVYFMCLLYCLFLMATFKIKPFKDRFYSCSPATCHSKM